MLFSREPTWYGLRLRTLFSKPLAQAAGFPPRCPMPAASIPVSAAGFSRQVCEMRAAQKLPNLTKANVCQGIFFEYEPCQIFYTSSSGSTVSAVGSRRSSAPGNGATACAGCGGECLQEQACKIRLTAIA
jgi:hypothetical protein